MLPAEPVGDGWRYRVPCSGGCGASVVVTVEYLDKGRCIECGRMYHGASVAQRPAPGETRRNGLALGQPGKGMPGHLDPTRLSFVAEPSGWPASDPAPEVTSRDPRPEGAPVDPIAVKRLQRAAEAAGWPVRVGYSRAQVRTRSVGVYKTVETIGVWAGAHDGIRWCAMYQRTVGARTGWKWADIVIWGVGGPDSSYGVWVAR